MFLHKPAEAFHSIHINLFRNSVLFIHFKGFQRAGITAYAGAEIRCESWLLSPTLKEVLPPSSKILGLWRASKSPLNARYPANAQNKIKFKINFLSNCILSFTVSAFPVNRVYQLFHHGSNRRYLPSLFRRKEDSFSDSAAKKCFPANP